MVRTKFQQSLSIFVKLANAKAADATGPGIVVGSNPGVEVPK